MLFTDPLQLLGQKWLLRAKSHLVHLSPSLSLSVHIPLSILLLLSLPSYPHTHSLSLKPFSQSLFLPLSLSFFLSPSALSILLAVTHPWPQAVQRAACRRPWRKGSASASPLLHHHPHHHRRCRRHGTGTWPCRCLCSAPCLSPSPHRRPPLPPAGSTVESSSPAESPSRPLGVISGA